MTGTPGQTSGEGAKLEMWGIVELMGHQRMAGPIAEMTVAGAGFIRVDVPETSAGPAFTRIVSPSAVYAINPTTEELARRAAASSTFTPAPVRVWELPPPRPPEPAGERDDDDEGDGGIQF